MEISVNDREMIMVMKCYFQTKVELAELKASWKRRGKQPARISAPFTISAPTPNVRTTSDERTF
ncbi:hypothetical protein QO002_005895 [Pararhizobium capsulatum DSM 1112]|uniref:Uncharacterized protein n=1 Tax=Pararhizobium capsulatum DSM 1112 TaxID=1121113 RepID=A0ABU0BZK0_9HYPH|nr:hypothetical protein [Pararhizobium capsulatum]MDQ0323688.1 hypothetical protein [Pararhizobium capsulatum DSM 1112]